jgi:hypothetical protein
MAPAFWCVRPGADLRPWRWVKLSCVGWQKATDHVVRTIDIDPGGRQSREGL